VKRRNEMKRWYVLAFAVISSLVIARLASAQVPEITFQLVPQPKLSTA
jgi:hypothetical protein